MIKKAGLGPLFFVAVDAARLVNSSARPANLKSDGPHYSLSIGLYRALIQIRIHRPMTSKYLIIGATGALGHAFAKALQDAGLHATLLVRDRRKAVHCLKI